jgi:hypothetical protein
VGSLVRTLEGPSLEADLTLAFTALARIFLSRVHANEVDANDVRALDALVRRSEEPIDLRAARRECPSIDKDSERPGEVFDQLGHMLVLIETIPLMRRMGLDVTVCAPTQGSSHGGKAIPDLGGTGWALEAFGGHDFTNNDKLARDLRTLATTHQAADRRFISCRCAARTQWATHDPAHHFRVTATCSRNNGGPYRVTAYATVPSRSEHVLVVEVKDIVVES